MHDDRHAAFVCERRDAAHRRVTELEVFGAWVQLDPGGAAIQRALGLTNRVAVGIDPAERDELTL